jgi:hypothetical protein
MVLMLVKHLHGFILLDQEHATDGTATRFVTGLFGVHRATEYFSAITIMIVGLVICSGVVMTGTLAGHVVFGH